MHDRFASSAASVIHFARSESVHAPITVHVLELSADESFIDFHASAFSAAESWFAVLAVLRTSSETVEHEPSGFLGDAQGRGAIS